VACSIRVHELGRRDDRGFVRRPGAAAAIARARGARGVGGDLVEHVLVCATASAAT